ncbi:hypothetical protein ACET6Z_05555 [Aeromonas veronii]
MNAKNMLVALSAGVVCVLSSTNAVANYGAFNKGTPANLDINIAAAAVVSHELTPALGSGQSYTADQLKDHRENNTPVATGSISTSGPAKIAVSWRGHRSGADSYCAVAKNQSGQGALELCFDSLGDKVVEKVDDDKTKDWYTVSDAAVQQATYKVRLGKGAANNMEDFVVGKYTYVVDAATFVN